MQDNEKQVEEIIYYTYVRDGVEYCTSNRDIAGMRSDTGEYHAIYGIVKNNSSKK